MTSSPADETLRRDDVGQLAVGIADQRDERRAVGIVFEPLDLGRNIELAPLEVDDAIGLLVAAAAETHGDPASVVAAALRGLALGQRLDRLALVELAAVDDDELAKARRDRLECLQRHWSILTPSSQTGRHVDLVALGERHDRFLDVALASAHASEHLVLALAHERVDRCRP